MNSNTENSTNNPTFGKPVLGGRLSSAQAEIVEALKANPDAYILATRYHHFQCLILPNGEMKYFTKPTREVLVKKGIIVEFAPNKFMLNAA